MKEGNDIALLSIGPIGKKMEKVVDAAAQKGISVAHYDMRFLKPIDQELLHAIGKKFNKIVTIEDACITGGLGSAVTEFMSANSYTATIRCIGIPDKFIEHGTTEELYKICRMDCDSVLDTIVKLK